MITFCHPPIHPPMFRGPVIALQKPHTPLSRVHFKNAEIKDKHWFLFMNHLFQASLCCEKLRFGPYPNTLEVSGAQTNIGNFSVIT